MNNGDTMKKEYKIGDLVGYPRTQAKITPNLCLIVDINQKPYETKQYMLQSITTGELYVAIARWIEPVTSETQ